jgi:hypothetical protein
MHVFQVEFHLSQTRRQRSAKACVEARVVELLIGTTGTARGNWFELRVGTVLVILSEAVRVQDLKYGLAAIAAKLGFSAMCSARAWHR